MRNIGIKERGKGEGTDKRKERVTEKERIKVIIKGERENYGNRDI